MLQYWWLSSFQNILFSFCSKQFPFARIDLCDLVYLPILLNSNLLQKLKTFSLWDQPYLVYKLFLGMPCPTSLWCLKLILLLITQYLLGLMWTFLIPPTSTNLQQNSYFKFTAWSYLELKSNPEPIFNSHFLGSDIDWMFVPLLKFICWNLTLYEVAFRAFGKWLDIWVGH